MKSSWEQLGKNSGRRIKRVSNIFLSIFLSVALILSLAPTSVLSSYAEEKSSNPEGALLLTDDMAAQLEDSIGKSVSAYAKEFAKTLSEQESTAQIKKYSLEQTTDSGQDDAPQNDLNDTQESDHQQAPESDTKEIPKADKEQSPRGEQRKCHRH